MHSLHKLINSIHFYRAKVLNKLYQNNSNLSINTTKHKQLIISDNNNITTIGLTNARFGNYLLNDKNQKYVLGLKNNKSLLVDKHSTEAVTSIELSKGFKYLSDIYLS